jgi:signal transduction histidine kinase/ActR/RegA family two-component response regulator
VATLGSVVEVETRGPSDPVVGFINRYRHKDGSYRTLEWRARRVGDRIYAVARDATARVAAELALIEAKAAAEVANQAKTDFLANMSHEIRTPMTAILGYADNLLANAKSPEDIDAVDTIKRNGDHLLAVINDILDLSRIEAGKDNLERMACSPVSIVAETESLMQVRAASKGLSFTIAYVGPMPETIITDPVRLRQVLINLVGNAVKFTVAGQIRLTVRLTAPRPGQPRLMQFDVTDTGIGISQEQIGRLFQPFTQADESITRTFGGTGLGLAISKRLANKLGGDLTVVSRFGQGSTFTLTIDPGPIDDAGLVQNVTHTAIADNSAVAKPITPHFRPGTRILLAEDGLDNQRLLSHFLTKAGADVTIADNGEIALKKVVATLQNRTRRRDDPEGPFDLILMDMQMPVMDGYHATRELRQAGFTGPILALTAHAMTEDRQKCLNAGCNDHISKPVKRDAFLETVSRYLSQSQEPQTPQKQST